MLRPPVVPRPGTRLCLSSERLQDSLLSPRKPCKARRRTKEHQLGLEGNSEPSLIQSTEYAERWQGQEVMSERTCRERQVTAAQATTACAGQGAMPSPRRGDRTVCRPVALSKHKGRAGGHWHQPEAVTGCMEEARGCAVARPDDNRRTHRQSPVLQAFLLERYGWPTEAQNPHNVHKGMSSDQKAQVRARRRRAAWGEAEVQTT